jgi:hypothetical protein
VPWENSNSKCQMPDTQRRRANSRFALLIVVELTSLVGLAGCGEPKDPPPQTFAVTGKVVRANGKPFKGGVIEFHSTDNPSLTMIGQIKDDGTFTLMTMTGKDKLDGAVEGTFTATVTPSLNQDQTEQGNFNALKVRDKFTVKPTGENNFTVKLGRR